MPSESSLLIISLLIFTVVREVLHYKQVNKLQELLKSSDLSEYYRVRQPAQNASGTENILSEPNEIAVAKDEFDIRKVSSVIVDGEERPINII